MEIKLETNEKRNFGEIAIGPIGVADLFYGVSFSTTYWGGCHDWSIEVYRLYIQAGKRKKGTLGKWQRAILDPLYGEAYELARQRLLELGWLPFFAHASEERWASKEDLPRIQAIQEAYKREGILV